MLLMLIKKVSVRFDLLNKIFDNSSQIDCAGAILRFVCEKLKSVCWCKSVLLIVNKNIFL